MNNTGGKKRIAVIAGDGIGKEVMPEGLRVLEAAARRFNLPLEFTHFDWAHCDYYLQHGQMMPDDWRAQIGSHDAILFGAVGWPQKIPDHISLWGSLIKFRREFDQYVNLRPVRLMPRYFHYTPIIALTSGVCKHVSASMISVRGRLMRCGGRPGRRAARGYYRMVG